MPLPIGWVLLDKPTGISSAAALAKVKRVFDVKKAGHAGTLDPAASGLLLLAIGEACKFLSCLNFTTKSYQFSLAWGAATSTDDAEGEIIGHSTIFPDTDQIKAALAHFCGEYDQSPPAFSALKINGKRAYKLAREGQITRLPARSVKVHDFRMLDHDHEQRTSTFEVCFGKGGYVRAIGRDLAEYLGSCGHVPSIRRTHIGAMSVGNAVPLDSVTPSALLPLETVLQDIPTLDVTNLAQQELQQGIRCPMNRDYLSNSPNSLSGLEDTTFLLRCHGQIFGLGLIVNEQIAPKRLLARIAYV